MKKGPLLKSNAIPISLKLQEKIEVLKFQINFIHPITNPN